MFKQQMSSIIMGSSPSLWWEWHSTVAPALQQSLSGNTLPPNEIWKNYLSLDLSATGLVNFENK